MENRDMIRMANQIAAFFEAYPRSEALEGIAGHIRTSGTPRMRKQLTEYIEGGGGGPVAAGDGGARAQGEGQVLNEVLPGH